MEGEEEGEEEEEVPSTTETPGSDASTLRSRTPPREVEERRVGYLKASPELDHSLECRVPEETPASSVEEAAHAYVEHCTGGAPYGPHLIKKAVEFGDQLLLTAGSLEAAMEELRRARKEKLGEPLRGAVGQEVRECIPEDHFAYLEEMVEKGVPARREYPRRRVKADPYPSAMEHLDELYEKAWKDATWGILLMCSDETELATKDLVECPQGRVPKQLPDRSLSKEGRPIHAMLVANAATHKFHHPPALQPRHRQVARKAIWWEASPSRHTMHLGQARRESGVQMARCEARGRRRLWVGPAGRSGRSRRPGQDDLRKHAVWLVRRTRRIHDLCPRGKVATRELRSPSPRERPDPLFIGMAHGRLSCCGTAA